MVLRGVGGPPRKDFFVLILRSHKSEVHPKPQGSADPTADRPLYPQPRPHLLIGPECVIGCKLLFKRRYLLTNQFGGTKLFCPDMLCQIPMNHSQQVPMPASMTRMSARARGARLASFRCVCVPFRDCNECGYLNRFKSQAKNNAHPTFLL